MNPLTASSAPRHRTGALFPVLAFDEDTGVFLLADNTLGFGFLCHPATTTQGVNEGLNVMLNLDWPTGSGIQFTLWASPDIEPFLAAFQNLRFGRQSGPLQDGIDQRISFLRTGTREPLEDRSGLRARDIQLLVTVKLPVGSLAPTPLELGAARDLALRVEQCLKTTGFNPRQTEAEAYLRFMSTLINWGEQASWRDLANSLYDPKALINDQVADYDTVIGIDERGLWLGDRRVTVLSVKRYPDQVYLGGAIRYLGDPVSGNRGIRGNILITANIQFPDRVKSSGKIERDSQFPAHQTFGGRGSESLLKFQPSLAKKTLLHREHLLQTPGFQ